MTDVSIVIPMMNEGENVGPLVLEILEVCDGAAAFEVLAAVPTTADVGRIARGRRIAVLGDMLELGPEEATLHASLAQHPAMAEIDRVHCVGPRMKALYEALDADKRGRWVETADELADATHQLIDAGDVVLVKGSKGSKVSLVVDALKRLAETGRKKTERGVA